MTKATESANGISLAEQVRADQRERARVAGAKYYELLLRNDSPESGDLEGLGECMQALGRTADDLEGDLVLARQLAEVDAAEVADAKLAEPLAAGKAKRAEVTAGVEAERARMTANWEQRVAEVESECRRLTARRTELNQVISGGVDLRNEWNKRVGGNRPRERARA
ncbi:MAG TPA: hypothetical protein VM487_15205 [Phycisphaerae bacterium]|nr:hypothetical protein [Phycisphaerae bacterium]